MTLEEPVQALVVKLPTNSAATIFQRAGASIATH